MMWIIFMIVAALEFARCTTLDRETAVPEVFTLVLIGIYILLCSAVGACAEAKGRSRGAWFLISLITSPLLGAIIVACMGRDPSAAAREALQNGDVKICPFCAETIKRGAIVCKHCGHNQPLPPAIATKVRAAAAVPRVVAVPRTKQP